MESKKQNQISLDLASLGEGTTEKLKGLELSKTRGGFFCMGCWVIPSAIGIINGGDDMNDDPDGEPEGP